MASRVVAFEQALRLRTERLCLDFANTVNWHAGPQPEEELNTYEELVEWAEKVSLLTVQQAEHLRREAARRPEAAAAVLERAHVTREAIYHLFSATAHGHPADPSELATLNEALGEALGHARLSLTPQGFAWDWSGVDPDALDQMLWPVVQSAVDLLTSPELARVGECADDRGCGWLFLDTTKNHSRRWCDMRDCGNRAKARRHYARKKGKSA
jgi:predicted RNA-binding Zn ribbon-like protein